MFSSSFRFIVAIIIIGKQPCLQKISFYPSQFITNFTLSLPASKLLACMLGLFSTKRRKRELSAFFFLNFTHCHTSMDPTTWRQARNCCGLTPSQFIAPKSKAFFYLYNNAPRGAFLSIFEAKWFMFVQWKSDSG